MSKRRPSPPSFSSTHSKRLLDPPLLPLLLTPITRHLAQFGNAVIDVGSWWSTFSGVAGLFTLAAPPASALPLGGESTPQPEGKQYTPEGSRGVRLRAAAPWRFPINSIFSHLKVTIVRRIGSALGGNGLI